MTAFLLLSVSSPTLASNENIGEDDIPWFEGLPPIRQDSIICEPRKERRVETPLQILLGRKSEIAY